MNLILLTLTFGVVAPPYKPTAPPYRPPAIAVVPIDEQHEGKPTVRPMRVPHTYRTTAHQRWCMMCLGQHLRNYHGITSGELDRIGYRNWVRFHESLHDQAEASASVETRPSAQPASRPAGGIIYYRPCPTCRGGFCRLRLRR